MPTRSKLTVMGMYNYDNSVFEKLELPTGIEKEVAVMRILFDCADLELNLPHLSILKDMIGCWSKSNRYKWQTLYNTTNLEYNPIWNVDAEESETIERTLENEKSGSYTANENGTTTNNLTDKTEVDNTHVKTLDTLTNDDNVKTLDTETSTDNFGKLAGFNSITYNNVTNNAGTQNDDGTITDNREIAETGTVTDTDDNTITLKKTGSVTTAAINGGSNESTDSTSELITNTKTRHGNIGVTMTQQLIEAERNVAKFSIYEVIANDFKHYFCVMVY